MLNRPEDITGEQIMARKVRDIRFNDMLFINSMAAASRELSNVVLSIKCALQTGVGRTV